LKDFVSLFILEVAMGSVMKREVAEDPLRVRNLEQLGYELFGPVLSVEIAA
jgi:hypothetical protein